VNLHFLNEISSILQPQRRHQTLVLDMKTGLTNGGGVQGAFVEKDPEEQAAEGQRGAVGAGTAVNNSILFKTVIKYFH